MEQIKLGQGPNSSCVSFQSTQNDADKLFLTVTILEDTKALVSIKGAK